VARRMSDIETVRLLYLAVFVGLLVAAFASVGGRYLDLRRSGQRVPMLLYRDMAFLGLMCVPFVMILGARWLDVGPMLAGEMWWVVATSTPAVGALVVWLLFESFVVGKRR
jgi:hypothetical protein